MLDQWVDHGALVSASRDVAEIAEKHAADAEASRQPAAETVQALVAAGFARHFVPARWGGDAASFATMLRAVAVVGERCPSTAWVASLTAGLGRMAAYLPPEGQSEIWSAGPDTLIVGALMPLGRAEPGEEGWRLSGRWPFVSAIEFSDWALVCGMAVRSAQPPQARFFAVPRKAYHVLDTWFNVGMRATGSNTLVLENEVVPTTHSFSRDDLTAGLAADQETPSIRAPLRSANGLSFAAPMIGAGRGALGVWSRGIAEKSGAAPGGGSSAIATVLARSAGEIDAAELLLERAARVVDLGDVTPSQTVRNWRDCALAADLVVAAVDRLFRAAGTSAQADTHPLQRFWRDVNAASSHVVLRFEAAAATYAEHALRAS